VSSRKESRIHESYIFILFLRIPFTKKTRIPSTKSRTSYKSYAFYISTIEGTGSDVHSQKVRANCLNIQLGRYSAQLTEESDNEVEFSDADTDIPTYEAVGKVVAADAVSTIPEEIAELDTIGFDETVLLDE
jgi:hypothetical protein